MKDRPFKNSSDCLSDVPKTIFEWLSNVAKVRLEAIAIRGTDERPPLTYQSLLTQVEYVATQLRAIGLGAGDPIAIALENGADFLVTILSVASVATAFPLDPNQPQAEFERYFSLLHIKAVIVSQNTNSAIVTTAQQANIPIIEIIANSKMSAGQFSLSTVGIKSSTNKSQSPKFPRLEDLAILVGTSGSTGLPKIVSLTHESFFVSIAHAADWMQLTKSDRSLVLTPLAMLHALVRSSCPLLLRGGEVICTPGYNPAQILEWIEGYRPSFFTAVPSIYRSILQRIQQTHRTPQKASLRFLVTGSDKITPAEIKAVESVFNVPLIEFYGMSEVSPLPAVRGLPPQSTPDGAIGKVNPMWQIACMDENGSRLAAKEEGEIVLRGGYLNQLVGVSNERDDWFHTGDLGYLDEENFLYITGRVDNRINRGGKKVYAGDIEAVLLTHPEIKEAVVFGIPDTLYGECIGAVVVLHPNSVVTSASIRQFLIKRIADFKLPDLILIEDALPLNSFGKVKRKTLASHYGLRDVFAQKRQTALNTRISHTAPRTVVEQNLALIWSSLFKIESLSIHDNFFELGGHSLLATQMLSRIQDVFAVDLPIHSLFDSPTIAQLASEIKQQTETSSTFRSLNNISTAKIPLSLTQKRYWFIEQQDMGTFYSMPRVLEIEGSLNIKALEQSLQTIVDRHAILRTIFCSKDNEVYQLCDRTTIKLKAIDLQDIPESKRKLKAYQLLKKEAQQPFKLTQEYLIRFSLACLSPTSYLFMVNMHHIISDGWSVEIFWKELSAIYSALVEGKSNPLPPLPIQYADYVLWQQRWLKGARAKKNYDYWSKQLANMPTSLDLPCDRPRSSVPTYSKGKGLYLKLNPEFTQQLRHFCQVRGITPYMMFLAAWQLLLCHYSGKTDIVVMTPFSGRNQIATEPLIGLFSNILLLRTQCDLKLTFEQLLNRVRQNWLAAYTHQHISLNELIAKSGLKKDLKHSLSEIFFSLETISRNNPPLSGLKTKRGKGISSWMVFADLQLYVEDRESNIMSVTLFYNTDLFNTSTAIQIFTRFQQLLNEIVNYPEKTIDRTLNIDERLGVISNHDRERAS